MSDSTTAEEMEALVDALVAVTVASERIKTAWDRESDSYEIAIAIDRQAKALDAQIRYLAAWHPVEVVI